MRLFVAARARLAEDRLAQAVAAGTTQLVVLGAGLDSFAYRSPYGARLRVFEIDHPGDAGMEAPAPGRGRHFRSRPGSAMRRLILKPAIGPRCWGAPASMQAARRISCGWAWCRISPKPRPGRRYAMWRGCAAASKSYLITAIRRATLPPEIRIRHDARAAQVAAFGEAWITHFDHTLLPARLLAAGYTKIEDLGPRNSIPATKHGPTPHPPPAAAT